MTRAPSYLAPDPNPPPEPDDAQMRAAIAAAAAVFQGGGTWRSAVRAGVRAALRVVWQERVES